MPGVIEPEELARVVDFAERPRAGDWSVRSALVRYAQPEPERVSAVLELVRRIDFALQPQTKQLESAGPQLWQAVQEPEPPSSGDDRVLVGVLSAAAALDQLGDLLATWAADPAGHRPDAEVDRVVADVTRRLDELGVAREERTPPPRSRG